MKRSAPQSSDFLLGAPKQSRSRSSPSSTPAPPHPQSETPLKRSSASASKSRSTSALGGTKSSRRGSSNTQACLVATSGNARQDVIAAALKSELNGAMWKDPRFFKNAMPCGHDEFDRILDHCADLNPDRTRWVIIAPNGREEKFYMPTIRLFNIIGNAVQSLDSGSQPFVPFIDRSKQPLDSDHSGMDIFPDIIQYKEQGPHDKPHWCDLARFVEVKTDKSGTKEAIRQSARYARALFANQLGQRFVHCVVVCGTGATFLRFDRSGLVYSDTLDIYEQTREFIRAFSGWLLLRGARIGHNPMFTMNPATPPEHIVTVNDLAYRMQAVLYHRTAIRSRATLVLGLKRILGPSNRANLADAVLKLIWRDQTRFREGIILGKFPGIYGLCQTLFEGDVLIDGSPDTVYPREHLFPGELGNIFGSSAKNTDVPGATQDSSRVLSQLLMQPGRSLTKASNEFELIAGMIGALMGMHRSQTASHHLNNHLVDAGHWALVGSQVQHRDISVNNILLAIDGYEYPRNSEKAPEWERLPEFGAEHCAQGFAMPNWAEIFNQPNEPTYTTVEKLEWNFDPKRRLLFLDKVIQVLGRSEPFGFLSDLDMANILSLSRIDVSGIHMHRTGTPSFMAIKLLRATSQQPVHHTFIHDLESFFWVLLYVIASHQEKETSEAATNVLNDLNILDYRSLGGAKYTILGDVADGDLNLKTFGTTWAKSLAAMVQKFAEWIRRVGKSGFDSSADPDALFEELISIFLDAIPKIRPGATPKAGPPPMSSRDRL